MKVKGERGEVAEKEEGKRVRGGEKEDLRRSRPFFFFFCGE